MATLIIPPKLFSSLMREIYGFKSLKVNRICENLLKKKNQHANMCINLDPHTRAQITSFVHANDPEQSKDDKPALAEWHNDLAERAKGPMVVGRPCIEYTALEWKTITEAMTGLPSIISNPNLFPGRCIPIDLNPYLEGLKPLLKHMLSKGSNPQKSNSPTE